MKVSVAEVFSCTMAQFKIRKFSFSENLRSVQNRHIQNSIPKPNPNGKRTPFRIFSRIKCNICRQKKP